MGPEIENAPAQTLLSRTWKPACAFSLIAFVILNCLLQIDQVYSHEPICHPKKLTSWLWIAYLVSAVVFYVKAILVVCHWLVAGRESHGTVLDLIGISGTNVTILLIAGTSNLGTVVFGWGGTCIDDFGVHTPAVQTVEWLTCVPLLFYYVLAVNLKEKFTVRDYIILSSITLSMLCYCILQLPVPYEASVFFLVTAHISFSITSFFFLSTKSMWIISNYMFSILQEDVATMIKDQNTVRERLTMNLLVLLPMFPIIYYLGMSKAISGDMTELLYIIANILEKLIFSSVALDSYTNMLYKGYVEQIRANEARQAYLRYVMHEVRVPLSSISMGIEALQTIEEGSEDGRDAGSCGEEKTPKDLITNETLEMMREATSFMGDTLNSVLNMQKIEQGKFELNFNPFVVNDIIKKVTQTLRGPLSNKDIRLSISVDPNIPSSLVGDNFQIEHVLANLLSNAIKFSERGSKIDILLTLDHEWSPPLSGSDSGSSAGNSPVRKSSSFFLHHGPSTTPSPRGILQALRNGTGTVVHAATAPMRQPSDDIYKVKFAVRDYGVGISAEDQKKLFKPFSQIRPGELQQGGGSGVGLAICKQIIELHGGNVGVDSKAGEGSTFYFILPLSSKDKRAPAPVLEQPLRVSRSAEAISINILSTSQSESNLASLSDLRSREEPMHSVRQLAGKMYSSDDVALFTRNESIRRVSSKDEYLVDKSDFSAADATTVDAEFQPGGTGDGDIETGDEEMYGDADEEAMVVLRKQRSSSVMVPRPFDKRPVSFSNSRRQSSYEVNPKRSRRAWQQDEAKGVTKVLVVDDVKSNRKLLMMLLSRKGNVECVEAEDGREAVALIQQNKKAYDMVFMDNVMPHMTGLEATRAIRQLGFNRLVIGLTGNALDEDINEFLRAGADIVFTKPLQLDQLGILLNHMKLMGNRSTPSLKLKIVGDGIVPFPVSLISRPSKEATR